LLVQPEGADQCSEDRHRGIEYRSQSCGDRQHRPGNQHEWQCRTEKAHHRDAEHVLTQCPALPAQEQQGHQKQSGDCDAQPDQCQRSESRRGVAHEEKGTTPERGEKNQITQIA